MTKKVEFSTSRPKPKQERVPTPSEWVAKGSGDPAVKLTLRVPSTLHIAFKTRCVQQGISIQDKVLAMIETYVATADHPAAGKPSE